ncbi:MAG: guanylate kinase, partial [Chitinophagaceae bacterium]
SMSIFIDPPSLAELQRRLATRGTETPESLQARINKATFERSFKQHFNFIILNEDLSKAQQEAQLLVQKFLSGN